MNTFMKKYPTRSDVTSEITIILICKKNTPHHWVALLPVILKTTMSAGATGMQW